MEVAVYNIKGEDTGRKVMLNDAVFAVETPSDSNPAHVIYLDVKQYLGNQRQGTHKSKERSEVSSAVKKAVAALVAVISTRPCSSAAAVYSDPVPVTTASK